MGRKKCYICDEKMNSPYAVYYFPGQRKPIQPCGHKFHVKCLWGHMKSTMHTARQDYKAGVYPKCPLCNRRIEQLWSTDPNKANVGFWVLPVAGDEGGEIGYFGLNGRTIDIEAEEEGQNWNPPTSNYGKNLEQVVSTESGGVSGQRGERAGPIGGVEPIE